MRRDPIWPICTKWWLKYGRPEPPRIFQESAKAPRTLHRLTTFAGTTPVAGALALAAVATAGTAGAISSVDDRFLNDISSEGICYDSPKAAISDAH